MKPGTHFLFKILRAVFALCLFVIGSYWLAASVNEGYQNGFALLSYGEKAKDALSGVWFALGFIAYGAWELYHLVSDARRKARHQE